MAPCAFLQGAPRIGVLGLAKVKQFRESRMPPRPSAVFSQAAGRSLGPPGLRAGVKQLRKSEAPRHQSAVFSRAAGRCGLQKVKQLRKSRALRRPSAVFSRGADRPRLRKVKQLRKRRASSRQSDVFSQAAGMSLGVPVPRARSLGVSQGPGRAAAGRNPEGGERLR